MGIVMTPCRNILVNVDINQVLKDSGTHLMRARPPHSTVLLLHYVPLKLLHVP